MTRKRLLRPRDRRALLVGLLVLAPAAVYRVGLAPWLEYRSGLADSLEAERDLLARERSALAEAAMNQDRDGALRGALETASVWLLDAGSSIAASGALSRRITEFGRAAGVLIQEVQTGATDPRSGPLQSVAVRVRALGDLEGLSRLLHAIENGASLLVTSELTLRPAGVNDADLERGQLMSLGIVVTGLWMEKTDPLAMADGLEVRS